MQSERLESVPDTLVADEKEASAGARSAPASLLHLWKGSSGADAIEFHAEQGFSAACEIPLVARSETPAVASKP
jgi:hypothetical protein